MNSSKLLIFVLVLLATACSSSTSTNNNILESPNPPVSTNNILPAIPAPPVATAQSTNRIDISWAVVSGATYYRLSRALTQNATYNETYAGANLSFDDTALDAGVTYFYKLSACSDNNVNTCSAQSAASSATTQNINSPSADATYEVTFTPNWTQDNFPTNFPSNPHFSPLVGTTHNDQATFWETGQLASEGVKSVAETGNTTAITKEFDITKQAGTSEFFIRKPGGATGGTESVTIQFDINKTHPLLTLVTMVAPSPDWFVGVRNLALFENGVWKETGHPDLSIPLRIYDAGTDSGTTFSSGNQATSPREVIARLASNPGDTDFTTEGTSAGINFIGSFTIKRIK